MAKSAGEPQSGVFITFEGGEGVGKSTQLARLARGLRRLGLEVIETREPGGTPAGEKLRQLFKADLGWTPFSEALLNTAARAEHVAQVIAPAVRRGAWVVCDRFIDSTLAYQGYLHGLDLAFLHDLQRRAVGNCMPDLTLVFDMDPEKAAARLQSRGGQRDKYDHMAADLHVKLREAFLDLAAKARDRIVVINADQPEQAVERDIWSIVSQRFGPARTGADKGRRGHG